MMCRVMCRKSVIGWDIGSRGFTVWSEFNSETKEISIIRVDEDLSDMADTASAIKFQEFSNSCGKTASRVSKCVAECGSNPGGFSCE